MPSDASLESVWGVVAALATQHTSVMTWHVLPHSVGAGNLLAAVDSDGKFVVLVPLSHGEAVPEDNSGSTVRVGRYEAAGKAYIGVACLKPDLNDIFLMFVRDLVESLPMSGDACSSVIDAVHRWRTLFAEADENVLLSLPQIAGLLAELQTLEKILMTDPLRDLSVWTGPNKSQHDFRTSGHALEVKATMAREGLRLKISSVEQLNSDREVSLHLAAYRYESDPDGDSLPAAIARIRSLRVHPGSFDKLLLKAGYRGRFADVYQAYRLRMTGHYVYDVKGAGFPRITPASFVFGEVPAGTESLSYTIDLSGSLASPLLPDEVDAVYVDMKGARSA